VKPYSPWRPRCLRRLNVLSQTKAYLYWCRDWMERRNMEKIFQDVTGGAHASGGDT